MQIVATVATNNRTGDGARENKSAYRGLDSTWKFRPGIYLNHASFPLARRSDPIPSADKSGNLVGRGGEGREKWPTNRSWLEKRIIIRAGGRALYLHIGGADNDGAGFKLKCCLPRYLNTAAALCLSRVASSRVARRVVFTRSSTLDGFRRKRIKRRRGGFSTLVEMLGNSWINRKSEIRGGE